MPNSNTFELPPVSRLLDRWLADAKVIIDPFARNSRRGTYTNDLNPCTLAEYHMDAVGFCESLISQQVLADAVLFDPPFSPRQIAECYQQIAKPCSTKDTQNARLYKEVKDRLHRLLRDRGIAVSCGWNSMGFGLKRGYCLREVLLVPHGAAHNDTIVTVEMKHGC